MTVSNGGSVLDTALQSTRRTLLKLIGAAFMLGNPTAEASPEQRRGRSSLPSRGGITPLNATLTLVNDGAIATVAGTPTHTFGWVFAPGQIPPGHVPVFTASGATQPFSANPANARRYWPDGSLMFATFMLRPRFSVPAGRSVRVTVTAAAGSWPTGGARTISEIYAQNFAINCPPAGLAGIDPQIRGGKTGYGPTVQYGAFLTAANANNLVQTRHWLTGDAGESWCFTYNMSQTPGGAAHGQLVCNIYLHALTDRNGNLGGYRFMADLRQPYFTVDRPVKRKAVFAPPNTITPASGLNYSVNGIAYVPPNWPWPAPAGVAVHSSAVPTSGRRTLFEQIANQTRITSFQAAISDGTGSAAGNVLTVTNVLTPPNGNGHIVIGEQLKPNGASSPIYGVITAQLGGTPGGVGTYSVSGTPRLVKSRLMDGGGTAVFNSDISPNPFYDGATGGFKVVCPVQFAGRELPTNIVPSTLYWLLVRDDPVDNPGRTNMLFSYNSDFNWQAPIGVVSGMSAMPMPVVQWGNRFPICGADAEYVFFRGTGSIATDTPLRSGLIDIVHWVASGAIPPLNTALSSTASGGTIAPFNFGNARTGTSALYPFTPYSYGPCIETSSMSTGGNVDWINPIPNWPMHEFYNGDRVSYHNSLMVANGASNQCYDIADPSAPNVPVNLLSRNYTGMGAPVPHIDTGGPYGSFYFSSYQHTNPIDNPTPIANAGSDHGCNYVGEAYIRTGRLDLLDRVLTQVHIMGGGNRGIRNSPQLWGPRTTYVGANITSGRLGHGEGGGNVIRATAWSHRNLGQAALYYPSDPSGLNIPGNISFDGSQTAQYLQDFLTVNYTYLNDVLDPANNAFGPATAYVTNLQEFLLTDGTFVHAQANLWQYALLAYGAGFAAASGNTAVIAFMKKMGEFWTNVITRFGGWNLYTITQFTGPGEVNFTLPVSSMMSNDTMWLNNINARISWTPVSPSPTVRAFASPNGFDSRVIGNGDYVVWSSGDQASSAVPHGLSLNRVYVIADLLSLGGNRFQFNLKDLGGRYQAPGDRDGTTIFLYRCNQFPPILCANFDASYWSIFYAAAAWHTALGKLAPRTSFPSLWAGLDSAFAAPLRDTVSRNSRSSDGFRNFQNGSDCRWILQPYFS